jgi:hypothetical protein
MSFFKITDTTIAASKAQVKHTDFEEFYPAVNINMQWKTLAPFIQHAEDIYIKPVLGNAFYDELEGVYQTDSLDDNSGDIWQNTDGLNWIAPDGQTWNLGGSGTKVEVLGLFTNGIGLLYGLSCFATYYNQDRRCGNARNEHRERISRPAMGFK